MLTTTMRRGLIGWAVLALVACAGGGGGGGGGDGGGGGSTTAPDSEAPAVAVQNVRNNGVLHSGFLIGTMSDNVGVTTVEVSLDGGAFQPATLTSATTWKFPLPIPASGTVWKDNLQRTVDVRASDAANNPGTAATLTFRKGVNRDVNGDGYEDLVVGANGDTGLNRVYVFHSAGSAGVTTTVAASASTVISASAAGGLGFGGSVALGDVNGDGYADVVTAALNYNPGSAGNTGRVYVFHSAGSNGLGATVGANAANTLITGEAASNFFGLVAAGDVNGDGYADVAVGASGYNSITGRVYVFHGAAGSGIGTAVAAADANTILTGEAASNNFGSVALGDVNGDGFADLAAGAQGYSGNTGRVYVFHSSGTLSGITATTPVAGPGGPDSTLTGEAANHGFGASVALGDVNGDGFADLAAGARYYDPGGAAQTGRVYVFHSAGSAGVTTTLAASANTVITGEATINNFGTSVALGDVNGDGNADVVAGAYAYNPGSAAATGRAYVFHSAGGAGADSIAAASANTRITGEAASNFFGIAVAVGDVNGDGFADLAVGAMGYNGGVSGAGRAYVFHSSAAGLGVTITAAASATTVIDGTLKFGAALDL